MKYSLGSVLLFVAGGGFVAFAATIPGDTFGDAFTPALSMFFAIVGALLGRRRYGISCLLAGSGGALGCWIGSLLYAFVLPWNFASSESETMSRHLLQEFVVDNLVLVSARGIVVGFVLGMVVATLFWTFTQLSNRFIRFVRQITTRCTEVADSVA